MNHKARILSVLFTSLLVTLLAGTNAQHALDLAKSEAMQQEIEDQYAVALPVIVTQNLEITEYNDVDYGFTVEYPSIGWNVATQWHEPKTELPTITKRIVFTAQRTAIVIDLWKQPQEDIVAWVEQLTYQVQPDLVPQVNGMVTGFPTVFYIEENEQAADVIKAAFSDSNYTYLVQYIANDGGSALNVYLNLLGSFRLAGNQATGAFTYPAEIFERITQLARSATVDTCCGYTSTGNPFPCDYGNCTWWVYYSKGSVPMYGDAYRWGYQVGAGYFPGWYLSDTPAIGGIAWWDKNVNGAGASGHVAYITNKSGSNTWIRVSEMNYGGTSCDGEPRYVTINLPSSKEPSGYIRR